jgi:hypothetical protein
VLQYGEEISGIAPMMVTQLVKSFSEYSQESNMMSFVSFLFSNIIFQLKRRKLLLMLSSVLIQLML